MKQSPLFNYARNRNRRGRPIRIPRKNTPNILESSPIIPTASEKDAHSLGEEVYIIGGGPSLKPFDFAILRNKSTIVVNKSIFDIPEPNYFISVDYTFLRKVDRQKFNDIRVKKFFVADLSHPNLIELNGQFIDKRFNWVYNLQGYDLVVKAQRYQGIGYTFTDFNAGRNSGFCAFQLAVILGFKKIYFLGIDLNSQEETHYHGGYGERRDKFNAKLGGYFEHFKTGLKQLILERPDIQVISCSPMSRLNSIIKYCSIKEVFDES